MWDPEGDAYQVGATQGIVDCHLNPEFRAMSSYFLKFPILFLASYLTDPQKILPEPVQSLPVLWRSSRELPAAGGASWEWQDQKVRKQPSSSLIQLVQTVWCPLCPQLLWDQAGPCPFQLPSVPSQFLLRTVSM